MALVNYTKSTSWQYLDVVMAKLASLAGLH